MIKRYLCVLLLFFLAGIAPAISADCGRIGEDFARTHGGKLVNATPAVQKGKPVCVVVVVVPGQKGDKPRRVERAIRAD